ncbi:g9416 [Coccomyxa elongata]
MRLRESVLLKGENFDLETANCDLLSPSLLQGDEDVDSNGDWPFPELPSPPKSTSCARAVKEAKQAAACEALAKAFEDLTPSDVSREQGSAPEEEHVMQPNNMDLSSPVFMRPPIGGGRRRACGMDPRRVSLAIAQNFDAAVSEGGLLGDDEFLELTGKPAAASRQPSAEAAKAAVLRASNSAFAGEGKIRAHRPEPLTVPIREDDELDMGPVMVESPIAARPPRRAPHQPLPAQQSVAMRDSMSLFLQLEGAVKGENGFAADDVLRLNRAGRPPLPSIAEDQAAASAPGNRGAAQPPLPKMINRPTREPTPNSAGEIEGMRDSMAFFLQLEGAVEGKNGFQPNDVLRLTAAAAPNSDVPAPATHSVPAEAAPAPASEETPAGPPSGSNLTRPAQQPTSHIPSATLSKIRRPAAAMAGRPSTHLPSAHRTIAPADHHHIPSGCPEALQQPTTSSSSLMSARRAAPSQIRHLPTSAELPALGRAGRPGDNAAAAGRAAGPAATARGAGTYGPASGRPVMRKPTIEPFTEKTASPLLSRHVGPRSYMATRSTSAQQPAIGPLAAGRLQSESPAVHPRGTLGLAPRSRLQSGASERVLQPKQAPQSRLPRPPVSLHKTPTPTKGSKDFQRLVEEAMTVGDASAFTSKGGLKNSPLDGKPEPSRKPRPTAEQRHFQEYRDF